MNGRRRCRFGIFQLGGWHTRCELCHDGASNLLRINGDVVLEAVADARQERISAHWLVRTWVPALIVETAQQGRKLRTKSRPRQFRNACKTESNADQARCRSCHSGARTRSSTQSSVAFKCGLRSKLDGIRDSVTEVPPVPPGPHRTKTAASVPIVGIRPVVGSWRIIDRSWVVAGVIGIRSPITAANRRAEESAGSKACKSAGRDPASARIIRAGRSQ